MKNNIAYPAILSLILIFGSCHSEIEKKNIDKTDIEMILQEFTVYRINQYLFASEVPKDNYTILGFLIKQHGYNYSEFLQKFKELEPKLYKKLFVKVT